MKAGDAPSSGVETALSAIPSSYRPGRRSRRRRLDIFLGQAYQI